MPLQKLSAAFRGDGLPKPDPRQQPSHPSASSSAECTGDDVDKPVRVYKWTEFHGKEQVTEFPESHFSLEGHFESNSSAGHKEFQDRIRAIHFRREGKQKAEIAKILGRSDKFVAKWWQKDENEVPRPWGVHEYLSKEMGQKTFQKHRDLAEIDSQIATSTASWWRDVEVRRKYHVDPAIYEELLHNSEWTSSVARTRDFATGASHLRYDRDGKVRLQGNQGARYKQGQSPAMDKLLQKFFAEYGLADRTSGILLNWYPDGDSALGSHRHDCWTALFSFGAERILTLDKTPLLCQDGDLVIFGTQRHGVPIMPEINGGRITVPIFFYPDYLQMQKQWQTMTDPEDPRASRALVKLEHEKTLSSHAWDAMLWTDPVRNAAATQLMELGCDEATVKAALVAHDFDVEKAANALLLAGAGAAEDILAELGSARQGLPSNSKFGAMQALPQANSSSSSAEDPDAALAWKLHMELQDGAEVSAFKSCCSASSIAAAPGFDADDEDMSVALAAQLEEEERQQDPALLAAQFEAYEEKFLHDDAEQWHGHGDLMITGLARNTLTLENMDKTTSYSLGHGRMREKDFYELLSLNSIRVLYDFRASDHRGDVYAPNACFSIKALRSSCKVRGIQYKHVSLGRESAYGILPHISSDEAHHALIELVWHAKRRHTAFLGFEEDWRHDHRQVIAEELQKAGHTVKHITSNGALEDHVLLGGKFPDFIMQEEERLRKLEKMRHAGELKRPEKSAVDRSTEVIAARLDRPAEAIDAMDELRSATNQRELEQVQRRLARVQRIAEKKDVLANKVLENTPQWILQEAKEQQAWISKKKAEKEGPSAKAHGESEPSPSKAVAASAASSSSSGSTAPLATAEAKMPSSAAAAAAVASDEPLRVECSGCSLMYTWPELAAGDGRCSKCLQSAGLPDAGLSGNSSAVPAEEDLLVECASCDALTPWSLLSMGDGHCPGCKLREEPEAYCLEDTDSLPLEKPAVAAAEALPTTPSAAQQFLRRAAAEDADAGAGPVGGAPVSSSKPVVLEEVEPAVSTKGLAGGGWRRRRHQEAVAAAAAAAAASPPTTA